MATETQVGKNAFPFVVGWHDVNGAFNESAYCATYLAAHAVEADLAKLHNPHTVPRGVVGVYLWDDPEIGHLHPDHPWVWRNVFGEEA